MAFLEERLPVNIEMGSGGGPQWMTQVVILDSGHEQRNQLWAQTRGMWDVDALLGSQTDISALITFFQRCGGKRDGFRFKDYLDYRTFNEPFGTGDGGTAAWQLKKAYGSYQKDIRKPVQGTLLVSVAGVLKTEGTHYNVAYTTGIVTFTGGNIPGVGQALTWSGEYDMPVRFDTDHLNVTYADLQKGRLVVPLVEIRV